MRLRYLFVLGITGLMLAGCGGQEEPEPSGEQTAITQTKEAGRVASMVLPRTEELTGFEKVSSDRLFDPAGLHDYIGDDADVFANYGVKEAASADFGSTDADLQFSIDVYRFGSAYQAFGMYAFERIPEYAFVDVGTQGYLAQGSLVFFKTDYLIRISGYVESPKNDSAAVYLGMVTANRIEGDAVFPAAVRLLPDEGRIENTERYFPAMFLNHEFFSPAYTCEYHVGDSISTLFLIPRGSPAEIIQYVDVLKAWGNKAFEDQEGELRLFFCDDDKNGRVIMSSKGGRLAGVVNTPDRDLGMELLHKLWDNLEPQE